MNEIDRTDLALVEDRTVWQVNAAVGKDREDLADEFADTYVDAVLAVLTEAVH